MKDDDSKPLCWAIDLDGSLAFYEEDAPFTDEIGKPIEASVQRVRDALARGEQVWVFTARISPADNTFDEGVRASQTFVRVAAWVKKNIGQDLPITSLKNRLWKRMEDDRGVELIPNLGITLRDLIEATYVSNSNENGAGQDSSSEATPDIRATYRA